MAEHRYFAKVGSHLSDDDAQLLGTQFALLAPHGTLGKEDVLAEATSASSPIHDYFEWDNEIAAHKFRLEQARYYLGSIEIELFHEDETLRVRAFHSIRLVQDDHGQENVFAFTPVIIDNPDWLDQIIRKALAELIGWRKRYNDYSRLANPLAEVLAGPIQEAIDVLENGVPVALPSGV